LLELLRSLAVPRLHGSPGARLVEARIRAELDRIGLEVEDLPFQFSVVPGRFGASIIGFVLAISIPAAALLVHRGMAGAAAAVLGLPVLVVAAAVLAVDLVMLRLPIGRVRGVNLLARPAGGRARFLVVAHRDSKSQPLPLILRVGGAAATVVAWLALLVIVAAGGAAPLVIAVAGAFGGTGGLLLACCGIGNRSDGALDNASGVAALLRIAEIEAERGSGDVAFLVTDAEEYGLAGARAAAGSFPDVEAVINLDGLDDLGPMVLIEGRAPMAAVATRLTWTIDQAAAARELQLRHRGLPPGLLLDHVPFSKTGLYAFTIMRGNLRSLARVHRPGDRIARISGAGVALVADIVSDALHRIRSDAPDLTDQRVAHEGAPG
jgi:hypothetical protein